jgi:hydrogenase/urease accessory protein HupE
VKNPARVLLVFLLAAGPAQAHSLNPAFLDVREVGGGIAEVLWKTPGSGVPGASLAPVLPPRCRPVRPPAVTGDDTSITARWAVDCGTDGWVGQRVGVDGLARARTDALVRLELADGRLVRAVVRPDAPLLTVPARARRLDVVRDCLALGVEHILTGPDHLLFVLGLVLLVAGARRLLATVTAFTLGHSVTLSLAVLGLARIPAGPTEVLIALSVYALAVELARGGSRPTFMCRVPWLVAAGFGLLHGLGFAGALRQAGLPAGDVPLALAAFNAGVEVGQLVFIAGVLLVRRAVRYAPAPLPRWSAAVSVYAMGSFAALWCFERLAALAR